MTSAPSSRPTVSVAMCTYKGERFVAEQVRSILAQSAPVVQLVVSDDSPDRGTVDVIEGVFAEHEGPLPGLLVLRNEVPLRVTKNFEQAVSATTGDLVVLCDQDDAWRTDRVEVMLARFEAQPDLTLLHSDARLVDEAGAPLRHSLFESIGYTGAERAEEHDGRGLATLFRRNVATGATVMFRRSLLEAALPFDEAWVHDEWLAILAAATGRIDVVDEQLIDYRQHDANQIGASKPTLRQNLSKLREPRDEHVSHLVARSEALYDRAVALDLAPELLERFAAKRAHDRWRLALPAARALRAPRVLASYGRYATYGRGRYDVLRDLLQPVG